MSTQNNAARIPRFQQNRTQSLGHALLGAMIATVATTTLLWIMNFLIKSQDVIVEPPVPGFKIDIFRTIRSEEILDDSEPEIERIPDATPPPEFPADDWPAPTDTGGGIIPEVDLRPGEGDGGPAIDFSRGHMPVTKFPANYPASAVRRGIEGHCDVVFTVTKSGAVRDVSVIKNQCTDSVFYTASIHAAERFKYMPTIVDGETVETPNVRTRFRFTLEN